MYYCIYNTARLCATPNRHLVSIRTGGKSKLAIRTLAGALSGLCLAFWPAFSAAAAEAGSDNLPWKTWEFALGGYLTTHDSTLRVDSDSTGSGTEIDLEDDLGFNKSLETVRFDATWRFRPRHRADFSYYHLSRDAFRTLDRTIKIGNTIFPINTTVASELDMTVYKASYSYSVIQNARFDVGLAAGLHILDLEESITAEGVGNSESSTLLAPLPVLGLRGDWAMTPRVFLKANVDVFAVSVEGTRGRLTDALVAVEYDAFKHFGVGLGYNYVSMLVRGDKDDFRGEIGASYGAIMLYGKLFFN